MIILGTRPEIIRLSIIIKKLEKLSDLIIINTGQNYTPELNDNFWNEFDLPKPNYNINCKSNSFGRQVAIMIEKVEKIILHEKPDKVLILGDTNSGLTAFISERYRIPVYHMEAGNRCFDKNVPEELNRKMIDHVSTYNIPYTRFSKQNLVNEGFDASKIYISGNPIIEVLFNNAHKYEISTIGKKIKIETISLANSIQANENYILVTFHRSENVDNKNNLKNIIEALQEIAKQIRIICSIHPRTKSKIEQFKINTKNLELYDPFSFNDFVWLEKNAQCIITDSGTVCEEACILQVPCVIIRNSTERPETVEVGASIVSGLNKDEIIKCYYIIKDNKYWEIPQDYKIINVSDRIINYLFNKEGIN